MTDRSFYALTHVASQILYRWLPRPGTPAEGLEGSLPFGASWPKGKAYAATLAASDFGEAAAPGSTAALDRGACDRETLADVDWRDLMAADLAARPPQLSWLSTYLYRYDPDGRRLAAAARQHFTALAAAGGTCVTWTDPQYPWRLRALTDAPHALSVSGDPQVLSGRLVSVVGSRQASALAVHESYALGRALAASGHTVVSGGAYGCDIAAHHGSLAAWAGPPHPALAVCVFAGGLSRFYPAGNAPVFLRMRERRAAFVSERLWFAPCRPADFHVRNRLIAGMSAMTVVMQAAARSGAMVTARLALDAGREVAVLRHPDGDIRACGSAALLADGAPGFASAADLLPELSAYT